MGTIDPGNPKDAKATLIMGLIVTVLGGIPFYSAIGIIPSDPSDFLAPRWLVALIAASFPAIGLFLVSMGLRYCLKNELAVSILKQMAPIFLFLTFLCFMGGGSIFLTLQFFNPTGNASVTIGPVSVVAPPGIAKYLNRIFIGFFALILDGLFIACLIHFLKRAFGGLTKLLAKSWRFS